MAMQLANQARDDAKETQAAMKGAKVGGDGTAGASEEQLKRMMFKPDRHAGVWGNEDNYQRAMDAYVSHLGQHQLFSVDNIKKEWPIEDTSKNKFEQKTWWPQGPTHLAQYCTCTEDRTSARYRQPKVRRNHCPECGYLKNAKQNENEYIWDPVVDDKKGKPLGDVFVQDHVVKTFHVDENHKNSKNLSKIQRQVGKERALGRGGDMGESYNANLETRQIETSQPDGPASIRHAERNFDLDAQLAAKKKEELRKKIRPKTESQVRNSVRTDAERANRLAPDIQVYHWDAGEAYPYGERDKPSIIVEGPARERADQKRRLTEKLMNQPHNVTDSAAYTSGNILEELHSEQRSGRISSALRYYELVSSGRKNVMKEVTDTNNKNAEEDKMAENKIFEDRKKARLERERKKQAAIMAGGQTAGTAKLRSMAKTTFNQKSLHSLKHQKKLEDSVKKRNKKYNKMNRVKSAKIGIIENDKDNGGEDREKKGKKKKRKRRKEKEKEKEKEESEGKGKGVNDENVDKKDKKRKSRKHGNRSNSKTRQSANAETFKLDSSDEDDTGTMGLTNLAEQQKLYQEKLEKEKAELEEAKRLKEEEAEKERLRQEVRTKMERETAKAEGKKRKNRRHGNIEGEVGSGAVDGEGGSQLEKMEEGSLESSSLIIDGDDGTSTTAEGAVDDGSLVTETSEQARKRRRDFVIQKLSDGIYFTLMVLEYPFLLIPPYKRYKAKRTAARLLAMEGANNTGNTYDNVFQHAYEIVRSFVMEKLALIYVVLFAIYMELMRAWRRRYRVYTIDDLEGGAYDGDNALVVKCFAQRVMKGQQRLDVNGRTPEGKTPLQCCFEGLLQADLGVERDEADYASGKKVKSLADKTGLSMVGKMLGVIDDPITKYNRTLATLLSMKADIHCQQDGNQSEGFTLLHLAAQSGNTKRIGWLLAKGCDIHKTTYNNNWTPLHVACMHGKSEAAMMLMTRGSVVDQRDKNGATALHHAARRGGTHMTRIMLLCGAKKSIWDNNGETPFNYAINSGRKSTVESLLVFRPSSVSSKQSINFLFQKMLDEGEYLEGGGPKKKEAAKVVTDSAGGVGKALGGALKSLFKKAATTVTNINRAEKIMTESASKSAQNEFDRYS